MSDKQLKSKIATYISEATIPEYDGFYADVAFHNPIYYKICQFIFKNGGFKPGYFH